MITKIDTYNDIIDTYMMPQIRMMLEQMDVILEQIHLKPTHMDMMLAMFFKFRLPKF